MGPTPASKEAYGRVNLLRWQPPRIFAKGYSGVGPTLLVLRLNGTGECLALVSQMISRVLSPFSGRLSSVAL